MAPGEHHARQALQQVWEWNVCGFCTLMAPPLCLAEPQGSNGSLWLFVVELFLHGPARRAGAAGRVVYPSLRLLREITGQTRNRVHRAGQVLEAIEAPLGQVGEGSR